MDSMSSKVSQRRITRASPDQAMPGQIGGHTRFEVGWTAEVLSRTRAAGDARAVRPLDFPK